MLFLTGLRDVILASSPVRAAAHRKVNHNIFNKKKNTPRFV